MKRGEAEEGRVKERKRRRDDKDSDDQGRNHLFPSVVSLGHAPGPGRVYIITITIIDNNSTSGS
jgi:hypothetical protein